MVSSISSTLLKALGVAATGGGLTTLAVGGVGVVSTSAGVMGAGVAAYAAAEAINESSEENIIEHNTSTTAVIEEFSWNTSTTNITSNHGDFVSSHTGAANDVAFSEASTTLDQQNSPAEWVSNHTDVDPQIAKALSNYHDMKGIMQDLGFIKVEADEEFSSSHLYGCPTQSMSQSNKMSAGRSLSPSQR